MQVGSHLSEKRPDNNRRVHTLDLQSSSVQRRQLYGPVGDLVLKKELVSELDNDLEDQIQPEEANGP